MNTSKLWSALVLSCIACGSNFHSNDASIGGDGNEGGASFGGDPSSGGDVTFGGRSSGGKTGKGGGSGHAGSTSSGGATSSGGVTSSGGNSSVGGDLTIAGSVGLAGGMSGGGVVGVSGGSSSGGAAGSSPSGGAGGATAGAGGSGGADCSTTGKLWTNYMDLVTKSELCDLAVTGECVANSNIVTQANCPIPVNQKAPQYDAARKALDAWKGAGCTFKITMCLGQPAPTCQLDANMAATCVASTIVKN